MSEHSVATDPHPTTRPPDLETDSTHQHWPYSIRPARRSDIVHLNAVEVSAGQLFRAAGYDIIADDDPLPVPVLESYLEAGHLWVAIYQRPSRISHQDQDQDQQRAEPCSTALLNEEEGEKEEEGEIVGFLAAFPIPLPDSFLTLDDPAGKAKAKASENQDSNNPVPVSLNQQPKALLHIAELSVSSSHQRRGLGKRFLETLQNHIVTTNTNTNISDEYINREGATNNPTLNTDTKTNTFSYISGISLTTYTHLPFNGGFYRAQGFEEIPPEKITGEERMLGNKAAELWEEEQRNIKTGKEFRRWMVRWV